MESCAILKTLDLLECCNLRVGIEPDDPWNKIQFKFVHMVNR